LEAINTAIGDFSLKQEGILKLLKELGINSEIRLPDIASIVAQLKSISESIQEEIEFFQLFRMYVLLKYL
jgi:hypothetical protein